ncbi:MAG: hypothetical protein ACR2JC_03915 [Chloroflexota bacterium]|nr:MAG: hypothetical protein DLM70_07300 [Chloroflexota bacterium]
MEAYDLSHKLAYAGRRCPIPFTTGPDYMNAVPGLPVLAMLRIFVEAGHWSEDNIKLVAREIAGILGPSEQFDIGMTLADNRTYDPDTPASADTARLMKLNPHDPHVILRFSRGIGDTIFRARFPRLIFEPVGEDLWRSIFAPDSLKIASQP